MQPITNKKIAIIGFGKEGLSCANYFGAENQIFIYDKLKKSEIDLDFINKLKVKAVFFSDSNLPKNVNFDFLIRSPGVRPDDLIIKKLSSKNTKLTSAIKIFFEQYPGKVIGVTGTKGKGTTSTLIYELLRTQSDNVFLAGNIGLPVLDILPKLNSKSTVVLELSSFQLIDLTKSPHIAVILMITAEHLNWHKSLTEYQESKQNLVNFQSNKDFCIINADFPASVKLAKKTKAKIYYFSTVKKTNGIYLQKNKIISNLKGQEIISETKPILLPGKHNLQNIMAAASVAKLLKIKSSNIKSTLKTFKGLKHRLQFTRIISGVSYYNDSYSTIPETTIAAIKAIRAAKILILGGSSKNSDFTQLAQVIAKDNSIKKIILIGQEAQRIKTELIKNNIKNNLFLEGASNMNQIIQLAGKNAKHDDCVILSPACASFGMFKNYEDRGNQFIDEVNKL